MDEQDLDPRTGEDPRLETGLDQAGAPHDVPLREDASQNVPTDPPAVVPTAASEQTPIAAALGLSSFARTEGTTQLTGEIEEQWGDETLPDER